MSSDSERELSLFPSPFCACKEVAITIPMLKAWSRQSYRSRLELGCRTNAVIMAASSSAKLRVMDSLVTILVATKSTEVTPRNQLIMLGIDE